MKKAFDYLITSNPMALIISGMIMVGCSLVGVACLTWPDAFYGIIGTFLP
jgi:hypothetical protein